MVMLTSGLADSGDALDPRVQQNTSPAKRCVLLVILLFSVAHGQEAASGPGYQNSDPLGCGTFHARRIQGTVIDQTGSLVENTAVWVFDDVSQKLLATAKADNAGRFTVDQRLQGRLRIIFVSPGFLKEDWAVTIAGWPVGGFFHSKTMQIVLRVPGGDTDPICNPRYSRR
jgi:Carboxypeptidase regulatory-like domain